MKIERVKSSTLGLALSSGSGDYPGCKLTIQFPGFYITLRLPQGLLKPECRKVTPGWDEATIERLGRDWYWDCMERRYGGYLHDGFLCIHHGRHTMDSSTDQSWGWFLPWTQWRFVRHSLYDLDGRKLCDLPQWSRKLGGDWFDHRRKEDVEIDKQPKAHFDFLDYDGEAIKVRCRVEEREWRFGTGYFKWLSLFRRARISRTVDLDFSKEVGRRKGSWKGGTVGHAVDLLPGESVEFAFRRYCGDHNLTFLGPCPPWQDRRCASTDTAKEQK
jgi:hypothetical protein